MAPNKDNESTGKVKKSFPFFKIIFMVVLIVGFFSVICAGLFSIYFYHKLPEVTELQDVKLNEPLKIYTRDNKLISEIGEIKRTPVTYNQIPDHVIKAFLAAEDSRFFQHVGIDLYSMSRAVWQFASDARQKTGASTITMQLARNFYLTRTRTLWRKFREVLLAIKIERELSKEQIITLYLNKIFLGFKSYGIAAAAKNYYSKTLDGLTLSQAATLAGLPKAPSKFNPTVNPSRAMERRDWILSRMLELGYINQVQQEQALAEDITPTPFWSRTDLDAQYVAEMVRLQLLNGDLLAEDGVDESFVYNEGLKVYTTIDSSLQLTANNAVSLGLIEYEERHGYKGAEKHYDDFDSSADAKPVIGEERLQQIYAELAEMPNFSGLLPAALVYEVKEKTVLVHFSTGEEIELQRGDAFPFQGIFIHQNKVNKAGVFTKFLRAGDVIRLRRDDSEAVGESASINNKKKWLISQVPSVQGALSSIDPLDGAIRALVGGFYYYHSKFNRAIQAERLMGSSIKPLVYGYAMEKKGYSAGSVIMDSPLRFEQDDTWRPQNSDLHFLGPITLRKALYLSRNVVSIRLLSEIGVTSTINFLKQFDLSTHYPKDLSLALGTLSSTTLQVARSFSVYANSGFLPNTYLVERIESHNRKVLYQANAQGVCYNDLISVRYKDENSDPSTPLAFPESEEELTRSVYPIFDEKLDPFVEKPAVTKMFSRGYVERYCQQPEERILSERIVSREVSYLMNDILKGIARGGTASKVNRNFRRRDFGGKTGTTNDNLDAWFTGVHPLLVTSVWIGFDAPQTLGKHESGSKAALPIWLHYTKKLAPTLPNAWMKKPEDLVSVYIDSKTGDRVSSNFPKADTELFRKDNLPERSSKIILPSFGGDESQVLERPENIF